MLLERNKKNKKAAADTPNLNKTKKPPSKKRKIESDSSEDELKVSNSISLKSVTIGKTEEESKSISSNADNNEVSKSVDGENKNKEEVASKKEAAEIGKQTLNMFFGMFAIVSVTNIFFFINTFRKLGHYK